jgi:hypothetical protein
LSINSCAFRTLVNVKKKKKKLMFFIDLSFDKFV